MGLLIRLIIELAWSLAMLALQIVLIMVAIGLIWLGGIFLFIDTYIGYWIILGVTLIVLVFRASSSKSGTK